MTPEDMYDLVLEATRQALHEELGGPDAKLPSRLAAGTMRLIDDEGRTVKDVPIASLVSKVTAVREKLRVLEQKINNHPALDASDQADLQGYITRAYGSLTTFNVLFRDDRDKFKGTGGR